MQEAVCATSLASYPKGEADRPGRGRTALAGDLIAKKPLGGGFFGLLETA